MGESALVNVTVTLELVTDTGLLSVTVVPEMETTVVPVEIPLAAETTEPTVMLAAVFEDTVTVAELDVVEIEVTTV